MTKEALLAAVNTLLASNQPITAGGMHRPSMHSVIDEMYDSQSRGDVLKDVTTVVSLSTGDKILLIRGNTARLIDRSAFATDPYGWPFPQATVSGTNTYSANLSPTITTYTTGNKFQLKFTNGSTGLSTINLSSVGARKIFINPTTQVTTGHITAGQIYILIYDAALDG